jgi:hypothetical protein
MNKKTAVIYVYLALFAFTLGFSFTLASQAQADPDSHDCCIVEMCPPPGDDSISKEGHWVIGSGCIQQYNDPCDWSYLCP